MADLYTKLETATTKENVLSDEIAKLTAQVEAATETDKILRRDLDNARNESRRLLQQLETRDEEEDIIFTDMREELQTEKSRAKDDCEKIAGLKAELRATLDNYKITMSNRDGSILALEESLKVEASRYEAEIQRLNDELTEEKSKSHDLGIEMIKHKLTVQVLTDERSKSVMGRNPMSFQSREPMKEELGRQSKRARLDEHDEEGNSSV